MNRILTNRNSSKPHTRVIRLVLICLTACVVVSCTPSRTASVNNSETGAAAVFTSKCAICHGADGAGKIINRVAVPSLREGRAATDTDAQLNHQITNGGNGMPAFGSQLSRADIEELVRYIREELQKN